MQSKQLLNMGMIADAQTVPDHTRSLKKQRAPFWMPLQKSPNKMKYHLFDKAKTEESITPGKISKEAFSGTIEAKSKKEAERENPGNWAIPPGQLTKKEREWVNGEGNIDSED